MKFNFYIKTNYKTNNLNESRYIEIPFHYKGFTIKLNIYNGYIIVKGLDEQRLFNFRTFLDFSNLNKENIKLKSYQNNIHLYFKNTDTPQSETEVIIKQVNNKLFFKCYFKNKLFKRAFCYINKENNNIYKDSSYIVFKHLINHKNKENYKLNIISDNHIKFSDPINKEFIDIIIFSNNIIKTITNFNGKNSVKSNIIRYCNTKESLYYINNIKFLDFLFGAYEVSKEEIDKIKLIKNIDHF